MPRMAAMPDAQLLQTLIQRCARQDAYAFEHLYRLLSPRLYAMCLTLLHQQDLAEEALQEGFWQVWRDAGNYNPHKAAPQTWVGVIVRHRALDLLRHQRRSPFEAFPEEEPPDPAAAEPWEAVARRLEDQALRECMDELSGAQRDSVTLAFFQGLTHAQLSQRLKKPLGTIKSWVRRGLEQLKRCLEP